MTTIARAWGALATTSSGTGAPVVMLHSLAMCGRMWDPFSRELCDGGFRVVTVDARGHGRSRWDGTPFSIADLTDDVAAAIEELELDRVVVVGMSMGGCVAIALASGRPELVGGLVLADTTADYGLGKAENWAARAGLATTTVRHEQLEFQRTRWFTPSFVARAPAEVERVCDLFVATDSNAHAQACYALGAFCGTDDLARIKCPALIIVGEQDEGTPPDMARALHAGIARSRLELIPDARHFALLEARERWPEVVAWIRAISDSPSVTADRCRGEQGRSEVGASDG